MKLQASRFSLGEPIPKTGILLIRHGPKVARKDPLESTPLSKQGILQVREFALRWNGPTPIRVTSSPIDRCMDTASIINRNLDWEINIEENRLLGLHGPYVINARTVGNQLKHLDDDATMQFFRDHINGEDKEGMDTIEVGSIRLLSDLIKGCDNGLILAISHDVIISALSHYLGIISTSWPEPLEGIIIKKL